MPAQQRRLPRQVAIDPMRVMQGIHDQYAGIIAQALQENAELTQALETLQTENGALRAQVEALRGGAGVQTVALPASASAADA